MSPYGYVVLRDPATAPVGWANRVTVIHSTQTLARLAAADLCRKEGGRFLVFERIAAVTRAEPPVEWDDGLDTESMA
jgi:hypothetical protein